MGSKGEPPDPTDTPRKKQARGKEPVTIKPEGKLAAANVEDTMPDMNTKIELKNQENPRKTEKTTKISQPKTKSQTEPEGEPDGGFKVPDEGPSIKDFPIIFDAFISKVRSTRADKGRVSPDMIEDEDKDMMQQLFRMVFKQHKGGELSEEKNHLPILQKEELDGLLRLFWAEVMEGGVTSLQWKNRLRDLTKAVYGSRRSLTDTIELRENEIKVRTATSTNPWAANPLSPQAEEEDEPMEAKNTIVRFRSDAYNPDEIEEMRAVYTVHHSFPSELRPPTELEKKITQGILEGNILAQGLPQFLKRTCDNDMLRAIQNTIHAQVEGELYFQFPTEFPIYPDFQTRERLVGAILLGAKKLGFDLSMLTQMLGETKQVCYNSQRHSVHLFFWTRETSTGWAKVFEYIPFRNRRFVLRDGRPADNQPGETPSQRSVRIWKRQIGSDGIRNEERHNRYRVKLLNVSRFLDEAALDAFIRAKFKGSFATFQEPKYGRQTFQTGAWEIYFKSPGCPGFLENVKFVNWMGQKILVHHVGSNPAPPCYNCGTSGHTVAQCRSKPDSWTLNSGCINVITADVESLELRKNTVTSFQELEMMWTALAETKKNTDSEQKRNATPGSTQTDDLESSSKLNGNGDQKGENNNPEKEVAIQTPAEEWKTLPRNKSFRPGMTAQEALAAALQKEVSQKTKVCTTEKEIIDLAGYPDSELKEAENKGVAPITRKVLLRPDALSKQNRLISESVGKSGTNITQDNSKVCEAVEVATLGEVSGYDVLKQCGLSPVPTPRTGNCQFYGVAMAMLNKGFEGPKETTTIEKVTTKLKKGVQLASEHGFDVEFPHEIRKILLSTHIKKAGELTIEESKTRLQEHIQDLCSASSKSTSFISRTYWGSEMTLLMMAKLLQRSIYLVIARTGLANASYQIFKPIYKVTKSHELASAGEFNHRSTEASHWIASLQQDCKELKASGQLPIVLHYGEMHYTWLRFGEAPSRKCLDGFYDPDVEDIRDIEDNEVGNTADNEMEEAQVQETTQHQFSAMDNKNHLLLAIQESDLTDKEREELREVLLHGDGCQQVLDGSTTGGPQGLTPGLQKLLANLSWDEMSQVKLLCTATGEEETTLRKWQLHLQQDGIKNWATSEEDDEGMGTSEASEWTQDEKSGSQTSEEDKVVANATSKEPPDIAKSRFSGGGRRTESTKRKEWNAFEVRWRNFSDDPFPSLPIDANTWERAVKKHPNVLSEWLQQVDSPEYILRTLKASTIMDWSRQYRIDCLLIGMTDLKTRIEEQQTQNMVMDNGIIHSFAQWTSFIRDNRKTMMDDSYVHSPELWGILNKLKADRVKLLHLCRKGNADKLSRKIMAAYAYSPELGLLQGQPAHIQFSTIEVLNRFVSAL